MCCRVTDARRSVNATGALPVQLLCPLTKVICLLTVGTAVLIMQTGKEGIKSLKDLFSQTGEESLTGVAAAFHKPGRSCQIKAGGQREQEYLQPIQVSTTISAHLTHHPILPVHS